MQRGNNMTQSIYSLIPLTEQELKYKWFASECVGYKVGR